MRAILFYALWIAAIFRSFGGDMDGAMFFMLLSTMVGVAPWFGQPNNKPPH